MKTRILYISAALLTLALAGACTKITPTLDREQGSVIGYNVVTSGEGQAPTKAASAFPISESFISSAYAIASSENWDDNSSSPKPFFDTEAEEVKWQGTYWSTEKQYYWSADKKLTFFSYAPSSLKKDKGVSITREGVSASGWDALGEHKDIGVGSDLAADLRHQLVGHLAVIGTTGIVHAGNDNGRLTPRQKGILIAQDTDTALLHQRKHLVSLRDLKLVIARDIVSRRDTNQPFKQGREHEKIGVSQSSTKLW